MLQKSSLAVMYLPVERLQLDPKNPRRHSTRQIKQLAKSIESFGFNVPILIDANNKILAGHGRWQACKELGWKEVPTIQLAHLTAAQARAFNIADNRLTDTSDWNDELLVQSLQELADNLDLNFDLEAIGFTMGEIDFKIEALSSVNEAERDPIDELEAVKPDRAISQVGDIWQLGNHRIFCGNALELDSYKILMRSERASMIFTDPPYNVRIDGHCTGLGVIKHREFPMASGEMSKAEFTDFLLTACELLVQHSDPGSLHYIFMDWRHANELLNAAEKAFAELKNICVWVKDNGGMGSLYRSQHELVFVFKHGKAPHRNNVELGKYGRYRTNVWNYPGANTLSRKQKDENLLALHPTVKPIALIADVIMDVTARNDIVLDSFLGSGSTLLAAERVGRRCYGIELDPLYVDTALRRWQKWTGDNAIHVTSGKSFDDLVAEAEVAHG